MEEEDTIIIQAIFKLEDGRLYTFDVDRTTTLYETKKILSNAAHILKNSFTLYHEGQEYPNEYDEKTLQQLFPTLKKIEFYLYLKKPAEESEENEHEQISVKYNIKEPCKEHIGKFLVLYCISCKKSICNECFSISHNNHEVEEKADYLMPAKILMERIFANSFIFKCDQKLSNYMSCVSFRSIIKTEIFDRLRQLIAELENKCINCLEFFSFNEDSTEKNNDLNLELLKKYCTSSFIKLKNNIDTKDILINDEVFLSLYNKLKAIKDYKISLFSENLNKFKTLNTHFLPFTQEIKNMSMDLMNILNRYINKDIYTKFKEDISKNTVDVVQKEDVIRFMFENVNIPKRKISGTSLNKPEEINKSSLTPNMTQRLLPSILYFNDQKKNGFAGKTNVNIVTNNNQTNIPSMSSNVNYQQVQEKFTISTPIQISKTKTNNNMTICNTAKTSISSSTTVQIPPMRTPTTQVPQIQIPPVQNPTPQFPPVQVPSVQIPPVQTPAVQLPPIKVPSVQIPQVQLPPVQVSPVQVPQVQLPPVQVPSVQIPPVQVPPVQIPPVQVPPVQVPPVQVPSVQVSSIQTPVQVPPVQIPQPQVSNNQMTNVNINNSLFSKSIFETFHENPIIKEENEMKKAEKNDKMEIEEPAAENPLTQNSQTSKNVEINYSKSRIEEMKANLNDKSYLCSPISKKTLINVHLSPSKKDDNFDNKSAIISNSYFTQHNFIQTISKEKISYEVNKISKGNIESQPNQSKNSINNVSIFSGKLVDVLSKEKMNAASGDNSNIEKKEEHSSSKKTKSFQGELTSHNIGNVDIVNNENVTNVNEKVVPKSENTETNTNNASCPPKEDSLNFMYPVYKSCIVKGAKDKNTVEEIKVDFSEFSKDDPILTEFPSGGAYCNYDNVLYFTGGQEYIKEAGKLFISISKGTQPVKAEKLPSMKNTHWNHSMIAEKGKIYVIGGYNSNKCEYYDISSKTWNEMPDLVAKERQRPMLYIENNFLYCFMGLSQECILDSVERIALDNLEKGWESVIIDNAQEVNLKFYGAGIIKKANTNKIIFIGGKKENKKKETVFKRSIYEFCFDDFKVSVSDFKIENDLYFVENKLYTMDASDCGNFINMGNGYLISMPILIN